MRKVTADTVQAFLSGTSATTANSSTDGSSLFLFGNKIAQRGSLNGSPGVFLTLAGWGTATTRERLNGTPDGAEYTAAAIAAAIEEEFEA